MFRNCVDKQAVNLEEIQITKENVDSMKRMFEGSEMQVDIKMKASQKLPRTPVIASSNSCPERWVNEEYNALHNRMYFYT